MTLTLYVFNSRTAIAGANIGLLLVFYNSKNLNCIGALSFFKSILLEWILKLEMKHVKKLGVILLLNKMKSGAKRVVFCSYCCFLESEKLRCEKIFCKRAKSFVHVRLFKVVFFIFFCYDFVLILACFWQWFEDFWQFMRVFMLFRRFFVYFADFQANFSVFLKIFCFTGSNGYWKDPLYLTKFFNNNCLQFCGYEPFFWEIFQKWNYFLNFLFFCNFSFFLGGSWTVMTCLLVCEHLDTPLAQTNFSLDLYAFVILRNLWIFQLFSASCFKSFFFS